MPRFEKQRFVQFPPGAVLFKPQGVPMRALEQVIMGLDEYEMLRLVDYEGRDIETAAGSLGVSRATAGRILETARKKSAEALCRGKAILIEGGTVVVGGRRFRCGSCGVLWDIPGPDDTARTGTELSTERSAAGDAACPSCAGENITELGAGRMAGRGGGRSGGHGQGGGRGGPPGGGGRLGGGRGGG
jgi:predicted DNA-binding protein (UPF0251 family)